MVRYSAGFSVVTLVYAGGVPPPLPRLPPPQQQLLVGGYPAQRPIFAQLGGSGGVSKAAELVKVPLESTTLQQLQNQGVDVTGLKDVDALVHGHDQGSVTLPGAAPPTTLGAEYDQFVNDWNS